MGYLSLLYNYRSSKLTTKINYRYIPCSVIPITEDGAKTFNVIYDWCMSEIRNKIVRTDSGGVSISAMNFRPPMWDVRNTKTCVELTIIHRNGCQRIQFRHEDMKEDKLKISGKKAFLIFRQKLKENGIDLEDYEIDNGEDVKKEIEKPIIEAESDVYLSPDIGSSFPMNNCHHIDFHNSYPAGLVNTHPEFRETVEWFYERRKEKEEYKAVLNYSIGFMQSIGGCKARWAQLSRDAIADNNKRIRELTEMLKAAGRKPVLYNTDGIWYRGEVYHGEGEGKKLGEWENDHVNCKLRIKSAGAYEFIEDGNYYPVVRGATRLDKVKPRSEWQWGDIYNKDAEEILEFYFIEGVGITNKKGEKI